MDRVTFAPNRSDDELLDILFDEHPVGFCYPWDMYSTRPIRVSFIGAKVQSLYGDRHGLGAIPNHTLNLCAYAKYSSYESARKSIKNRFEPLLNELHPVCREEIP